MEWLTMAKSRSAYHRSRKVQFFGGRHECRFVVWCIKPDQDRVFLRPQRKWRFIMTSAAKIFRMVLWACMLASSAVLLMAQGSYRAQLRGVVADSSGAVIRDAKVTITDIGTSLSSSGRTNERGEYFFTGLRPSTYSVK